MPNRKLLNPESNHECFGTVKKMKTRRIILPAGEIHLLFGKHIGPNKGFGACHIWEEHRAEMQQKGLLTFNDVPKFVCTIVKSGTQLYYENAHHSKTRLMAVRNASGTAILEFRENVELPFWGIVTAYIGTKKHGTLVGTVL